MLIKNGVMLILGMLVLMSCSNGETKTEKTEYRTAVETVTIEEQEVRKSIKALGSLEPNREMKPAFKVGGKLKAFHFDEGDLVRQGVLLAELDMTEYKAQKQKALENMNKTKRDMDRMEKLFKDHIVPEASLQDARSAWITAQAELKITEDYLANSLLYASFTGIIIQKISEKEEIVGPGNPIAVLAELDPILAKASIPENQVQHVKKGQEAWVELSGNRPGIFKGMVDRLDPIVDPLSRTFTVSIKIDNPGLQLRPGLIARIEILKKSRKKGIYIPLDAVINPGAHPRVFVLEGQSAAERFVKMGEINETEVEILEGLFPGENLIVSGQEYLEDKQPVKIVKKEDAQN